MKNENNDFFNNTETGASRGFSASSGHTIELPPPVIYLRLRLNEAGFEAYAVGGCVRDALLGRVPNDWDITTSALPSQVKRIFRRTVNTGIQHGTVTVLLKEGSFEVTTYRIDGDYTDGRHPEEVCFTDKLSEDLRRRDFTINAMAYHPEKGLADLFGGAGDLANGIIRAVGNPAERFEEDALRIMRAVRFAAQLGFEIEPETFSQVKAFAKRLELISKERIDVELVKLLASSEPGYFSILMDTGIADVIMPSLRPYISSENISALALAPADARLRLAVLFADCGADRAEGWLRDYKFDNVTIKTVSHLVKYSGYPFKTDISGIRRAVCTVGTEYFPLLLSVLKALDRTNNLDAIEDGYKEITARNDCVSLKQLAIKGEDLIKAGIAPGPGLGEALNRLLDMVLEDPSLNQKERLLALL